MPSRQEIIEKTYIDPIRSVIAVDDEFPMLDRLINDPVENDADDIQFNWAADVVEKKENARRLARLMRDWRRRKWIVDIHDGVGIGPKSDGSLDVQHIHQSDLVILDYELRREDRGEKSRAVIKRLARNPHFNMVVVFSKNRALDIFRTLRRELISKSTLLTDESHLKIRDEWEDWTEDDRPKTSRIYDAIVNETTYFDCRSAMRASHGGFPWDAIKKIDGIAENVADIGRWAASNGREGKDVVRWLLTEYEKKAKLMSFDASHSDEMSWSKDATEELNWIRSNKIFITIVSKTADDNVDLIAKLKNALVDWNPTPVRLIVSQMRSHLDEYGGVAEDAALSDRLTQAAWLSQILSAKSKGEREPHLSTMLARQTSALQSKLESKILLSAEDVISAEKRRRWSKDRLLDHHFDLGISAGGEKSKAIQQSLVQSLNTYECNIPVTGRHLTTGHILEHDGFHWVCVTPACDLVPEQRKGPDTWRAQIGDDLMPVKVLKLWPETSVENALAEATQSHHLFIRINDKPRILKITRSAGENPIWEQWFVTAKGNIRTKTRRVSVLRMTKGNSKAKAKMRKGPHLVKHTGVQIVAQLRYEYALNLLHRMGSNLSRVGLDFVGYKAD